MTNHTPGPWKTTKKFEIGPVSREDDQSNGMVIPLADVFGDNRDADARLIAAAPDLLAALHNLVNGALACLRDDDEDMVREAFLIADSAIAKAEGRA